MIISSTRKIVVFVGLTIAMWAYLGCSREARIDFSADVKPILNKKCISCHGGVKAKGGFSVLFREEALAKTESGKPAIIPGDPEASEMIRRIKAKDPEDRMPYNHDPLSEQEISILSRWIKQGARWGEHWAYVPLKKVDVPLMEDSWIKNDVDRFIIEEMRKEGVEPSRETDRETFLRRVSLDLIGMYPSAAVALNFLKSKGEKSYEILIDSLLSSPHFGERWASTWLDLARYADTKGYEKDHNRTIWRYRDWVIKAFNQNMPYDQFLTKQIAGDLLPDPSDEDYIATAFHRNTMNNDEAGTDNEEYRTISVMDRVNTTWEALMSTTFACVQCHSHPYDPFRHDEYYKFLAYFNNTRDGDLPPEYPKLREFDEEQNRQMKQLLDWVKKYSTEDNAREIKKFLRTRQPAIYGTDAEGITNATPDLNISFLIRNNSIFKLSRVDLENRNMLTFFYSLGKPGGRLDLHLDSATAPRFASVNIVAGKEYSDGSWENGYYLSVEFAMQKGVHDVYFSYKNPSMPANGDQTALSFDWFSFLSFPSGKTPDYANNFRLFKDMLEAVTPATPVMVDNPPSMWRPTHVFERGNMKTLGKEVEPAVPQSLSTAMPPGSPKNRLGLAAWLTSQKNPLVSRTMVNRLWEQLFGTGLAETLEDLGTQGIPPTHQLLLDHYAFKFMTVFKWDVKRLLKEIVLSATYRQDSKITEELKEKDVFNRLYARGPRIRLSAEQIRDQMLCISGVMSEKMYGPGVMPWQPEGIWNSPYNRARWIKSEGEDQYRRSVYTFWKRTAPYPSISSFDATQRVICNARRIRTNTPLQALVTLNDPAYLDMSKHFALRMQREGGKDVRRQISKGYELMTYKSIPEKNLDVLLKLYDNLLNGFLQDNNGAKELINASSVGETVEFVNNDPSTAAMIIVANVMLNLDEVVTKN